MVSEPTRDAVWQNCLDVSRLGYYYETLSNRYRRYYIWLRFALLVSVIASVGSQYTPISHPIATTLLVIATVMLVAVDYALDLAKKSAVLQEIYLQVKGLEADWEMLWLEIEDEDADDSETRRENRALYRRLLRVTGRSVAEGILIDDKLNRESLKTANKIIEDKYGYAHGE